MNSNSSDQSKSVGMSQLAKDRFEIGSKSIAILGGIISAIVLIITLQANTEQGKRDTEQRTRELRWSQTRVGQELIDKMLEDKKAFDALRMIDWERPKFSIKGTPEIVITLEEVMLALDVRNDKLDDKDVYIRECFDRLFYQMGKIERALTNNLVKFEDIKYPLDFYVGIFRTATYQSGPEPSSEELAFKGIREYMIELKHQEALALFDRFPVGEQ